MICTADADYAAERAEQAAELATTTEQDADLIDEWHAQYAATIEADRAELRSLRAREAEERNR